MIGDSSGLRDGAALAAPELWWPVLFPLCFSFLPRLAIVTAPILGWSIVLGVVTGLSEEVSGRATIRVER